MHIDFAPPSNRTNNAGSNQRLINYLEHEDLERIEKGIYTEGFFNLADDNTYKSKVIKDVDTNIGQLQKTDAKFYAIHVSPSEKELRAMGNTELEQAEAMKRYIREVFIPEYAKNFNKGLSETDIKFYGKIHFDRNRSDNELNMHCHLIVSRKDQAKKLSPLTNHKNTKNGIIKGGFDHVKLFHQTEQGFDKLFDCNRKQIEAFDYHNTMKNHTITEQLKLQERKINIGQYNNQENLFSINLENREVRDLLYNPNTNVTTKQENSTSTNLSLNQESRLISNLSIYLSSTKVDLLSSSNTFEEQMPKSKKRKKKKRKL